MCIRIIGTHDGTQRVVLAPPALDITGAYEVTLENQSNAQVTIANSTTGVGTGDNFALLTKLTNEKSLEQQTLVLAGGGTEAANHTYRTRVLVTTGGAYRVPGFTSNTP